MCYVYLEEGVLFIFLCLLVLSGLNVESIGDIEKCDAASLITAYNKLM